MLRLASECGQVPEGLVDTPALLVEEDEQSEAIRGRQRSSKVIRGHRRPSEVIRGHQRP